MVTALLLCARHTVAGGKPQDLVVTASFGNDNALWGVSTTRLTANVIVALTCPADVPFASVFTRGSPKGNWGKRTRVRSVASCKPALDDAPGAVCNAAPEGSAPFREPPPEPARASAPQLWNVVRTNLKGPNAAAPHVQRDMAAFDQGVALCLHRVNPALPTQKDTTFHMLVAAFLTDTGGRSINVGGGDLSDVLEQCTNTLGRPDYSRLHDPFYALMATYRVRPRPAALPLGPHLQVAMAQVSKDTRPSGVSESAWDARKAAATRALRMCLIDHPAWVLPSSPYWPWITLTGRVPAGSDSTAWADLSLDDHPAVADAASCLRNHLHVVEDNGQRERGSMRLEVVVGPPAAAQ